jgi:pimeloyl-ACP methyl ester carboxylesterase
LWGEGALNEASSKYVDQIATQKLIAEKLSQVHHAPHASLSSDALGFHDLGGLPWKAEDVAESRSGRVIECTFSSPVKTRYAENDVVYCESHTVQGARGEVVFVHGLYEDNLRIYDLLFAMLNEQGLDVHLLILPYHYERKPKESAFSGEYYWSADLERSVLAYKQAVYDLLQLCRYRRAQSKRPIWVVGFSMGGGVALTLSSLVALDGVFAVNPVCNFPDLVWHRPLFCTVKEDLQAGGVRLQDIVDCYSGYDPLSIGTIETPLDCVVLARGLYDQINDPANYDLLAEKWRLRHVMTYKAGHLNILRVPKLAGDIAAFCLGDSCQAHDEL